MVVGQTVDTTIAIYAMSDRLIVKADVDETDIGRVHLGEPAVVMLGFISGRANRWNGFPNSL